MQTRSTKSVTFFFLLQSAAFCLSWTASAMPRQCTLLLESTVSEGISTAIRNKDLGEAVILTYEVALPSALQSPALWAIARDWVRKNLSGELQGLGPDEFGQFNVVLEPTSAHWKSNAERFHHQLQQLTGALRVPLYIRLSQGQIVLRAERVAVRTPIEWATDSHFRWTDALVVPQQASTDEDHAGPIPQEDAAEGNPRGKSTDRRQTLWDVPTDSDPNWGRTRWNSDQSAETHPPRGISRGNTGP